MNHYILGMFFLILPDSIIDAVVSNIQFMSYYQPLHAVYVMCVVVYINHSMLINLLYKFISQKPHLS